MVAVLHDLNLAARYADRVAVFRDGRLVCVAPPTEALSADLLTQVYAHPISVLPHPEHGTPLSLPT